jgi:trk system potassium uptake protein
LSSVAGVGRRRHLGVLAVDVSAALNLVGALVKYFALAFLFPAAIAIGYGESPWPFVLSGLATGGLGLGVERATSGKEHVGMREGYLVVSLVWLLVAFLGAFPYLLSGEEQLTSPVDALHESMSGFTTTGATVLTDVEGLSRSVAMWRQFTQWLGGIGIVVVALAILPRLRVGGRQALFGAEAPGPELETLTATIRDTARRFVVLYVAITAAEVVVLTLLGWTGADRRMSLFEAVAHAFTTLSTGGFSTQARSLEEFGAASQWAIVPFMFLGGTSFTLLYLTLVRRRPRALARDEEFRVYGLLLALISLVVLIEIASEGIFSGEAAVRHAVVNTVSVMTTTGFASADFNQWTALTTFVLVGAMFVSASAGSTSGGIKLVRHIIIAKLLRRELDQTVHPELVAPIHVSGAPIDERSLRAVVVFAFIYVGIAAAGALALLLDAARADLAVTPFQAIAAAAATLGNVGPAFGFAGPMGSFDPFSDISKVVMIVLMWLGRLEIIPVAVLLSRHYWRA